MAFGEVTLAVQKATLNLMEYNFTRCLYLNLESNFVQFAEKYDFLRKYIYHSDVSWIKKIEHILRENTMFH